MDALVQLLQPHLPASAALEIQKHCAVIAAADNGAKHDTPQLTPSQWAHRLVQPEVENIRALQQRRALRIRGAHASWQARTCAQADSKQLALGAFDLLRCDKGHNGRQALHNLREARASDDAAPKDAARARRCRA